LFIAKIDFTYSQMLERRGIVRCPLKAGMLWLWGLSAKI